MTKRERNMKKKNARRKSLGRITGQPLPISDRMTNLLADLLSLLDLLSFLADLHIPDLRILDLHPRDGAKSQNF